MTARMVKMMTARMAKIAFITEVHVLPVYTAGVKWACLHFSYLQPAKKAHKNSKKSKFQHWYRFKPSVRKPASRFTQDGVCVGRWLSLMYL